MRESAMKPFSWKVSHDCVNITIVSIQSVTYYGRTKQIDYFDARKCHETIVLESKSLFIDIVSILCCDSFDILCVLPQYCIDIVPT